MPRRSAVHRRLFLLVALGVGWIGCTIDDPQVNRVGVVSLLTVDPAIVSQSVILAPSTGTASNRAQTMLWNITKAELTIGPDPPHDLLFNPDPMLPADCQAIDSPSRITTNFGTCVESLVVESATVLAGIQGELLLEFTVRLKRVVPITLPFVGDEDMDGVLNGNDNCILLDNPGQEDSGNLGIGNVCRVVDFFSGVQLDSDGDSIPDSVDNCVHRANPDQANPPTAGEFAMVEARISDGIGYACEDNSLNTTPYKEQIIDIPMTSLTLPFDFVMPPTQGFVLVDFNNEVAFSNCDWAMGTCPPIDSSTIQVCTATNVFQVLTGCS
jgi:hypothetical protein